MNVDIIFATYGALLLNLQRARGDTVINFCDINQALTGVIPCARTRWDVTWILLNHATFQFPRTTPVTVPVDVLLKVLMTLRLYRHESALNRLCRHPLLRGPSRAARTYMGCKRLASLCEGANTNAQRTFQLELTEAAVRDRRRALLSAVLCMLRCGVPNDCAFAVCNFLTLIDYVVHIVQ